MTKDLKDSFSAAGAGRRPGAAAPGTSRAPGGSGAATSAAGGSGASGPGPSGGATSSTGRGGTRNPATGTSGASGPSTSTSTSTGDAPPAPAALAAKVRTLAPSMTRSMQRVAEAVASDPAGCAALTVTGLAELTGTSEATVVRTARLLGYPGYRDLRLALAGLAAQQQSGRAPAVTADIAVDDPIADVVAKLAYDEQQTLADTAAGLDTVQLDAAVTALATARRIDIYGVGASGLVAQDLAQKLLRIGLVAHAHSDPHLAVTNAVQLRSGDAAVAISHSGSTGDIVEPLRVAFDHGATTVAITGRPDGPVSQYADHVLTTSTARETDLRPAAMSSRTGQLLVVDCLFIGVMQLTYDAAAPALAASYEALAHRHSPRTR
ncbi:MurR/RpiR family transcriptional regulator [Streptomyces sp. HNM0645]|uniref:MurR/RpiR family transcriptional regulator n=1 Tax=Streptomyces sp. HNM0645 TaxID=2782343 RepID=UPI0024B6EAB7|nr:MurR/RpiR family transcriptional regulator [Streptomyces sp. HNM0645]MDI9885953.1 MurR/RpiR family transcriptional regulator [Streptomyces sp. HNM0645]